MNGVGVELAHWFFRGSFEFCVGRIEELIEGLVSPCWASHFFQTPDGRPRKK
ncbi:hypothetical protein L686_20095 [Stutzerimonas stutzeri MF28]|nr:hypothetical protein L686_20095 [Stutzerimonas stutzeri MF28]